VEAGPEKETPPGIFIKITVGELLDRLAILQVKTVKVQNMAGRVAAQHEYKKLSAMTASILLTSEVEYFAAAPVMGWRSVRKAYHELLDIHRRLWHVEDDLRGYEARFRKTRKDFDEERALTEFDANFIKFARRVYHLNDRRSAIKKKINEAYGYEPEVKEHVTYDGQGEPDGKKEDEGHGTYTP
jgi:hypothetical protein